MINPLINSIIEDNNYNDFDEEIELENLNEFKDESLDIIEILENELFTLNRNNISETSIKNIYRAFHSIKGIAGFVAQSLVEIIAHNTETLLSKVQNSIITFDSNVFEIILNSVELIKQLCKNFSLAKDKKFNDIVRIHLTNIKNIKKKEMQKINFQEELNQENEDSIKISLIKINEIAELVNKIQSLNKTNPNSNLTKEIEKLEFMINKLKYEKINCLYKKLFRVARYTMKTVNINCNINFSGGEIILDKTIIKKIFVPLVQIIRNALVHGLIHKEGEKTLNISSYIIDNNFEMKIQNNGEEINLSNIEKTLKEKNIEFHGENLLDAIFLPDFSTYNQVDFIAGRGIGLDIVKTKLLEMNGEISVYSEVGKGTLFKLKIPI